MKDLYSIGEVSALLGISVQTLRYYSNLGLIKPHYTDPEKGYRYYAFEQFHYIDRIKYLQGFGLSLTDIKDALSDGEVGTLMPYLEKQQGIIQEELERVQKKAQAIAWYIRFFRYLQDDDFPDVPYKKRFGPRWILQVPCDSDHHSIHIGAPLALAKLRAEPRFQEVQFHRQNGYLLRFEGLLNHEFDPTHYYIYLKEKPCFDHEHIREIPAGEYLCFRGKVLTDQWDPSLVCRYFEKRTPPRLVVSDEYEYNLKEFVQCVHEVQLLINEYHAV